MKYLIIALPEYSLTISLDFFCQCICFLHELPVRDHKPFKEPRRNKNWLRMYTNYSTPYISSLVAVILFISLIENILRFEFFGLANQQQSDFIMIEQVFDISKLVLKEC